MGDPYIQAKIYHAKCKLYVLIAGIMALGVIQCINLPMIVERVLADNHSIYAAPWVTIIPMQFMSQQLFFGLFCLFFFCVCFIDSNHVCVIIKCVECINFCATKNTKLDTRYPKTKKNTLKHT